MYKLKITSLELSTGEILRELVFESQYDNKGQALYELNELVQKESLIKFYFELSCMYLFYNAGFIVSFLLSEQNIDLMTEEDNQGIFFVSNELDKLVEKYKEEVLKEEKIYPHCLIISPCKKCNGFHSCKSKKKYEKNIAHICSEIKRSNDVIIDRISQNMTIELQRKYINELFDKYERM